VARLLLVETGKVDDDAVKIALQGPATGDGHEAVA
jgi:hypothetical protein